MTGRVKLLVRGREGAPAAADPRAETIFHEDFEAYESGTLLSAAGWTMTGDMTITTSTAFGNSTKAIDGKTPTQNSARGYKDFTSPVQEGDSLVYSAAVHHGYGGSMAYVGMHTEGDGAVTLGNNGWQWYFSASAIGAGEKSVAFWPWHPADPWARVLTARVHVDGKTHTTWATLTDRYGTVHASEKVPFAAGGETKLTGAWAYMTDNVDGRNMDMDDLEVTRIPAR